MMVWSQSAGEGREKRGPRVLSCMGEVVCAVGDSGKEGRVKRE